MQGATNNPKAMSRFRNNIECQQRKVPWHLLDEWEDTLDRANESNGFIPRPPPWCYSPYGMLKKTPDINDRSGVIDPTDIEEAWLLLNPR